MLNAALLMDQWISTYHSDWHWINQQHNKSTVQIRIAGMMGIPWLCSYKKQNWKRLCLIFHQKKILIYALFYPLSLLGLFLDVRKRYKFAI
jgi:hypothetical protein